MSPVRPAKLALGRGCANFYEKALFVKPTWRLYVVTECNSFVPFALCFYPYSQGAHTLFGGSTCPQCGNYQEVVACHYEPNRQLPRSPSLQTPTG